MYLNNGKIISDIHLLDAYCECGEYLNEIINGFSSKIHVCFKCGNVYQLELRKVPDNKVDKKLLKKKIKFEQAKADWVRKNRDKYLNSKN